MMFVIIGHERERGILIDHVRLKNGPIPLDHLLKSARHIDDVSELSGLSHAVFSFAKIVESTRSKTQFPYGFNLYNILGKGMVSRTYSMPDLNRSRSRRVGCERSFRPAKLPSELQLLCAF